MTNNGYDKNKPQYEWGTGWTKKGVTEKQLSYIQALIDKIAQTRGIAIQVIREPGNVSRGSASGLIDELKRVAEYGDGTGYLKSHWSRLVTVQE